MTRDAVSKLLTETGHQLNLDDVDDILRLELPAAKIETPDDAAECDMLAMPAVCGNVVFLPPTMGKGKWYDECALEWFDDDPALCDVALGFVLCADQTQAAVWDLADPAAAREKIEAWWRTLACTPDAFATAIARVMPDRGYDSPDSGNVFYGPTCGLLAHEYGNTPAHWFYEVEFPIVLTMVDDYMRRMEDEAQAARKAQMKGAGARKPNAPAPRPSMRWQKQFRETLNEIREKWQKTQK
jgi:hypothetical protein